MTSLHLLLPILLIGITQAADAKDYIVEAYLVVEPQVVTNYEKLGYANQTAVQTIRGDMELMIFQVNKYFASMKKDGLDIQVRVKKLDMMKEEIFKNDQDIRQKRISGVRALADLQNYLRDEKSYEKNPYDIAVLLTGYDVLGATGDRNTAGYANKRAMCDSTIGVAVVEFEGTQVTAMTIAHELAHSLGAEHDQSNKCPTSDGYIMTTSYNAKVRNRWSFSPCSINDMKKYIDQLNKGDNCLNKTTTEESTFEMSSQYGRDILDPEKVCQRVLQNVNSYFCNYIGNYRNKLHKSDLVCQYLYCGPKGSRTCRTATPTEGMVCDVGKRCEQGKCVTFPKSFPTPKALKADCIFGDLKSNLIKTFRGTCDGFLKERGLYLCYLSYIRAWCCETCAAKHTGIKNCEYGDSSRGCQLYPLDAVCPNGKIGCCYTCSDGASSMFSQKALKLPV